MTATLTPKSALLLSTITMAAIDGNLDRNEIAIINRLDGFSLSSEWDLAIEVWDSTPLDECISLITEALNEKQQLVAMTNMIDLAMADGVLDEDENMLLRAYANVFTVPDAEVERILDVITIKNDKSAF